MLPKLPRTAHWGLATTLLMVLANRGLAADSKDEHLVMTTERAVIFKDGYYLAIKHATAVTDADGELVLDDVPDAAVLGSVWATSKKGKLLSITSSKETVKKSVEKEVACTQPVEILEANVDQEATVVLHDKTEYVGTIRRVLVEPTVAAPNPSLFSLFGLNQPANAAKIPRGRPIAEAAPDTATISGIAGSQFILRTEAGDVLLPVSQVRSLTIKEMKATLARTLTTTETPKRMTFRFAEPNRPVDLSLIYFRPGLRWIPTYRITLPADEKRLLAQLDLQAEFLNEAEDLDDVPVDVVVGVPNFRFKDTPSPLVLEAVMRQALQQAAPQLMGQQMMSNSFASRAGERAGQAEVEAQLNLPADLGAGGAQDLFIYNIPRMKLGKGQRAAMAIFSAEVPYRHLYTWDVRLTRHDLEGAPDDKRGKSPLQAAENGVWHQIVLSNNTKFPWTTGAAMVMQGFQPISQDLLTYTSPGAAVQVPLTVSVDTPGTYADEEVGRKLNSLNWQNHHYARIDKTTKFSVVNHKAMDIDVQISFRTGGKAEETSDDGKITLRPYSSADWTEYHGHPSVNNSSTVVWRATLKAGGTFSPTVQYHYFSRQ